MSKRKNIATTDNEIMETLLARETRKAIDEEIIKSILDPKHKSSLTPMIFETEEDKKQFEKVWTKIHDRKLPGEK